MSGRAGSGLMSLAALLVKLDHARRDPVFQGLQLSRHYVDAPRPGYEAVQSEPESPRATHFKT